MEQQTELLKFALVNLLYFILQKRN